MSGRVGSRSARRWSRSRCISTPSRTKHVAIEDFPTPEGTMRYTGLDNPRDPSAPPGRSAPGAETSAEALPRLVESGSDGCLTRNLDAAGSGSACAYDADRRSIRTLLGRDQQVVRPIGALRR